MSGRLLIIDGHALAFRAYFAFAASNLTNSKTGLPSGAVFGFWRMLFKLLQDEKVTHIAFTFDPGTRLERNDLYEDYKAHRKPMPEDLKPQIHTIYEMLKALEFPMYKIDGIEADDIIGSLCKKFGKDFEEIVILSSDKDLYQVLDKNIHMLRGKRGVSEFEKIDPKWVETNIGITKEQVPDYMGLLGDASDNIPGVKGVGEKGAAKLIQEFGNLETIYKKLDQVKNKSLIDKLAADKDNAFLSRKLATIVTNLKLDIKKSDLKLPNYHDPAKVQYFKDEGYNVLHRDLAKQAGIPIVSDGDSKEKSAEQEPIKKGKKNSKDVIDTETEKKPNKGSAVTKKNYKRIQTLDELKKIVAKLDPKKAISVDTETTSQDPMLAELLGVSFSQEPGVGYYIAFSHPESIYSHLLPSPEEGLSVLKPMFTDPKWKKVGQNIKYDLLVLRNYGVELSGIHFDTMLASYLLNPGERRHNMDDMAVDYLNYKTITYEELVGTGKKKQNLYDVDPEKVSEYACEDADITLQLFNVLAPKMEEGIHKKLFFDIEMPILQALADMEFEGIAVEPGYFESLSKIFETKIKEHEKNIHFFAGRPFNINSTKELQTVLFEDLRLPAEKKTQTGYSTDHSVLESLQGTHPIIDHLLEIRKFSKLKSTYTDTLPTLINPKTGRIHTSYNQTIAATGRLSSTNPNLQNIPIKDEEGRLLRKGFVAKKGYEILSLDYSQIELRIMAHFANDPQMINAYKSGADIHKRTAAGIFGVPEDQVTTDMRNKAKVVNFSVIYGVTSFGLSNNLKISRKEAKEFIEKYFATYKGVGTYMEEIVEFCKEHGYVETLLGRRRYLPDIHSKHKMASEAAKRVAINSPIQGTSADMIKLAMIQIDKKIKKESFRSKLLLQVHDELVFEVDPKEKKEFYQMAKEEMESAMKLKVPIVAQGKFGGNWDEAH
ncbi:DNA polymerase I [Leptospira sp. 2 VSF19]|uniref:DNA polymerase I n=1 Tax=Leptospira soteropolitanensis TaxID=2950025 RepID=A0AAW5VKP0_9LEPT|nr:DNA polymerase I [Leptospira soteropolitanensis]MCW7494347.1 DNA polymerase I [Leptospira soteropolitanensis]MCW7501944.1 DNA polymerase I [Leptospira soteropolitanensis]MCW7524193.1 DNA polymerase I [Leptospira soteropolitanensis]MCW7528058.1 DNA polymerase I [Leptospira soteropolitanensis]MCW7531912.1 DNA polymerase I [Leptospira soteropolitanensis]